VNGCHRRHHRLLHEALITSRRSPQPVDGPARDVRTPPPADLNGNTGRRMPTRAIQAVSERNLSCDDPNGTCLLFRILPVTLFGAGNKRLDSYALFDERSSVSMIDDELRRALNLKGERRQLNINWFGRKSAREPTTIVSIQICASSITNENQAVYRERAICSRH